MVRASLTIPTRHRDSIKMLASLGEDQKARLVKEVDAAALTESALRRAVASVLDDSDVFDALMSASLFRSSHGLSAARAAAEILSSLDLNDEGPASAETLSSVLAASALVTVAKAMDLGSTYERLMHNSRIITDVRPVFGDSENPDLRGSVIVHNLEVSVFTSSGVQELFVAMDTEDLDKLGLQVERARQKARALRETLADGRATVLDVLEGDEE